MAVEHTADGLLALPNIRALSYLLKPQILNDNLQHFAVSLPTFKSRVVPAVVQAIRSYVGDGSYSSIPPHGRWQHFSVGSIPRLDNLVETWHRAGLSKIESTKRVIDLTLVSVLLDAGAGNAWSYPEAGKSYARSEGLAVASFHMFINGLFSSDPEQPHQVDARALESLTSQKLAKGFKASNDNPLAGLEGRATLLQSLGGALRNAEYFGNEARPGGMLQYLGLDPQPESGTTVLKVEKLWAVLVYGLGSIWPTRTIVEGKSVGDAWHYPPLKNIRASTSGSSMGTEAEEILTFHKLSQWLCYSLLIPLKRMLGVAVEGEQLLTGLPEYRNGGLFVDYGALTLKPADIERGLKNDGAESRGGTTPEKEVTPWFAPEDEVIVEWRAATLVMLDMLLIEVNEALALPPTRQLSLAQMLEAGSWAAGREVAARLRPLTKGPPINIISDGTVF